MKEKKTGNVRDRGLNKDVCGASREVAVDVGMRDRGSSFKSGSQGLQGKRVGANSASVTACGRKGAWPCANPVRGPFPLLEGKSLIPS